MRTFPTLFLLQLSNETTPPSHMMAADLMGMGVQMQVRKNLHRSKDYLPL